MKRRLLSITRLSFPFASAIAALLTAQPASAITYYWDNLSTNGFGSAGGTWSVSSSLWSTSSTGVGVATGTIITTTSDALHFGTDATGNGLGGGTITVSGTVDAASLRFGSQTTGNILITGGTINLAAAATIHVGAGSPTVHTIASNITGAGTSLTKTGNALTLSGNNSYLGSTIISIGTLTLGSTGALGGTNPGVNGTSGVTIGGVSAAILASSTDGITISAPITTANTGVNSTISFGRSTTAVGSIAVDGAIGGNGNVIFTTPNVSSGGSVQTINLGSTSNNYAGNTTLNTGNANNALALRNSSGAADALPTTTVLTFGTGVGTGSGRATTFDLNGQNQTLAGLSNAGVVPEVRNQTVTSATAATLTINSTANHTFGGRTISTTVSTIGTNTRAQISGAISLVKSGVGTFTLGGTLAGGATAAGNSFTGSTQILGGILVLGESLSIQNSALDTASSIAGNANNGLRAGVDGIGVTSLTLGGLIGNKNFEPLFTTTTGGYTNLTNLTLNPGTGVTHSYSRDIGNGAGNMTLTKTGLGTQIFTGANTHTGGTTISNNGGILQITHAGALAAGAVSILTTGTNTGTLDLALTGTNNFTNNFTTSSASPLTTVGANAHILNTSGDNTISGTITLTAGGGNGTNIVSNGGLLSLSNTITSTTGTTRILSLGGSGNGLVSGAINDEVGFALSVQKSGAGTWTLSGAAANTNTGLTTVSAGQLDLNKTAGVNAVGGDVTVSGTGTLRWLANEQMGDATTIDLLLQTGGTVNLNGKTETLGTFTNSGGTFSTGAGTLIGTGATITWSGGTNTVNAGGSVQDQHIVISGGTNTVEGTGGMLQINGGGLGLEMSNGATLTLNSANNPDVAGRLLLKGDVVISGAATVSIASGLANAIPGNIDLDGINTPGARTFTVADGAAATDLRVDASLSNGSLIKSGAGTMALAGANSYSGNTTITAGTLELSGAGGALTGTSAVSLTGGTLLLSGGTANSRINDNANFNTGGGSTILLSGGPSFTEKVGSLSLGSGNSVIDFGTLGGTNILTFAASTFTGAGTLQVWNWSGTPGSGTGTDRLFFGTSDTDLNVVGFTGSVQFFSNSGIDSIGSGFQQLSDGQLVPVPEPSALLAAGTMGAAALFRRRRSGSQAHGSHHSASASL